MSTEILHITIPTEIAERIRDHVRSGEYASESDVIADRFLHDDDPAASLSPEELEESLRILQDMELHPETTFSIQDLQADLEEQHRQRLQAQ